jgi:transposase
MDYFAGLDISMDETHICVVDRDGAVVYEGKSASTAEAIADKLSEAPSCHRIVFETGRMAPLPEVENLAHARFVPMRHRVGNVS